MNTGLDGLIAIVRYHLTLDPYNGSVYVFRDGTGAAMQYIEWDGQSFRQSKRRAQLSPQAETELSGLCDDAVANPAASPDAGAEIWRVQ